MGLPTEPVTLTVDQINELHRDLSTLRHDINNTLSLIMAAVELIRYKPQMTDRMITTLIEQPPKILESMAKYSAQLERTLANNRS